MIKKVKLLLISLVMFFGFTLTVNANSITLTKKGSIEVTLKEGTNNIIKDAEITIYHIADAIDVKNNLVFTLKEELSECNIILDDLTNPNLVNEISKCNIENTTKYIGTTNEFGIAKFDNLDLGLYYIKQTKNVKGYSNFESFLIALPTVEDNVWIHDIKAKPKTDIYRIVDIVIKKEWNSHSNITPEEVTIELYNDTELIDSVKLNKNNNWTYTFKDMKLSDKYSVKEVNIPKGYTPSYKVKDYMFTVTNTDILASTGQIFYPIIIFFFLGVILILTGIKLIKNEE